MFLIGFVLFVYVVLRGQLISFVHDESYSFVNIASQSFDKIFLYNVPCSGNNHLLNSLFLKIINVLGFNNEVILRLPNIAAYVVYFVASLRILRYFSSPVARICGLCLLTLNQFMLEFFSLARGYGLGLGFMMLSVSLLVDIIKQDLGGKYVTMCLVSAALSVLSNFTFLNYYLVLVVVLFGARLLTFSQSEKREITFWARTKRFLKLNVNIVLISLVLAFVIIIPLHALKAQDQLYYGGTRNFYSDTIVSLLEANLYKASYFSHDVSALGIFVIGLVIAGFVFFGITMIRQLRKRKLHTGGTLFFLMMLCAFSTIAQFEILGTRYLIERTAILFLPLFNLMLLFLLSGINRKLGDTYRVVPLLILIVITSLTAFHFVNVANLSHTWTWDYDADTKKMIKDLIRLRETGPYDGEVTIAAHWIFQPSISFYYLKYNMTWLYLDQFGLEKDQKFDYYYYTPEQAETITYPNREEVKRYHDTGNVLSKGI